jgi:hypothetical protein
MDYGEVLSLMIILGGLYVMVAVISQVLSTNNTRRKLAEESVSAEQIEALMRGTTDVPGSLKMGIITIAIGVALIGVQLMPEGMREQPIALAIIFLFAGAAFLVYHRIARRE